VSGPVFSYSRDVTIARQEVIGVDAYGADVYAPTSTTIPGCVYWPAGSSETDGQTRDTVSTVLELLVPPGVDVRPTDTFVIDGQEYQVTGEPFSWERSPWTGSSAGRQIELTRVTG
jgi:hypothetical protein